MSAAYMTRRSAYAEATKVGWRTAKPQEEGSTGDTAYAAQASSGASPNAQSRNAVSPPSLSRSAAGSHSNVIPSPSPQSTGV